MVAMRPGTTLWAVALVGAGFAAALPQAAIATEPILSTITQETVVPSTVTIYSVATITPTPGAGDTLLTVTSTLADGRTTLLTQSALASSGVGAGDVLLQTETIYSTTQVTTTQVIVSTIGFSVITGASDANTAVPAPAPDPTAAVTTDLVGSTVSSDLPTYTAYDPSSTSAADGTAGAIASATTTSGGSSATSQGASSGSSSGGLSAGAKAGIAIGVIIGVIIIGAICFFFGQMYTRRRHAAAAATTTSSSGSSSDAHYPEKEIDTFTFRAGKPYELTASKRQPSEMTGDRHHPHELPASTKGVSAATTEVAASESGRSGTGSNSRNESSELSALPKYPDTDDNMYIGVPAHMSGSKRWSMKQYEKE